MDEENQSNCDFKGFLDLLGEDVEKKLHIIGPDGLKQLVAAYKKAELIDPLENNEKVEILKI